MSEQLDTYYFDASDAGPTDSGAIWTNDADAFDGDTGTSATTTSTGSSLTAEGTNAPASGATVKRVRGRPYGERSTGLSIYITEDSVGGTSLGTLTPPATLGWGSWVVLTPPAAGWTWAKVQSLAAEIDPILGATAEVNRIEIEVTSGTTINNFWGAETGGLEELVTVSGTAEASNLNTSILTGLYHYRVTGDTSYMDIDAAYGQASAGAGYIFGFRLEMDSVTPASGYQFVHFVQGFALTTASLYISATSGDVLVRDSVGATIRTITAPFTVDTPHYVEVYMSGFTNSETIEVFIDGVSQGEDTAQDLQASGGGLSLRVELYGGWSSGINDYDDLYYLTGCTSSADRLGPVEVLAFRSTLNNATPDADAGAGSAADILDVGTWKLVQTVPFAASVQAEYINTGAGSVKTDDSPTAGPLNAWEPVGRYHFDTSISGPTDADAVFTDDADAFDGSIISFAFTTTAGTVSSNFLGGKGTNAPASGESVVGVKARMYAESAGSGFTCSAAIYETGGGTLLATLTRISGFADWTDWITLLAHSGGWTWAKVQDLEVKLYDGGSSQADFYKVELEVYTTKSWGDTVASKAVVTMERSGGGGTDHFILLGNDVDGTTRGVDLDPTASPVTYFMVSELTSIVPLSTESCQIGFEMTNAQDFSCYGMLAQILHVPPVVTTSFPPHNPYKLMNNFLVR